MGKYAPGVRINAETGEQTFVELTPEEEAQRDADIAQALADQAEREAAAAAFVALKESAKAKLVAGTPLTEEEAATIVL